MLKLGEVEKQKTFQFNVTIATDNGVVTIPFNLMGHFRDFAREEVLNHFRPARDAGAQVGVDGGYEV